MVKPFPSDDSSRTPAISCKEALERAKHAWPCVPDGYFKEAEVIPPFWVTTVEEVNDFLENHVHKGTVRQIGTSAGGRPIRAVMYGTPRRGGGSTTFSGAVGSGDGVGAFIGDDREMSVFFGLGGVHGFELEGIMGTINLISVLETGADLSGKPQPALAAVAGQIDRIVLVPLVNPDGRARVPVRMEYYRGLGEDSGTVHQYLNTGGNKDDSVIGWPTVKKYIPMDFSQFGFPGGYPNDAGVNIMHDDFLGSPQPETRALLELAGQEKPDLILNLHTGVWKHDYYMDVHRPFTDVDAQPAFDSLYRHLKRRLTEEGLQGSNDMAFEADPERVKLSGFNLNTALNLQCGALCVVIESPCHGYGGTNRKGIPAEHSPENLLRMHMILYEEALHFLYKNGPRFQW